MNKGWKILLLAGVMEIVWAVALDFSNGFKIWYFDIIVVLFLALSMYLMMRSLRHGIPVGTAYAVWTGIGAVGTLVVSTLLGRESLTPLSVLFVALIIGGIIGLQLTSNEDQNKGKT